MYRHYVSYDALHDFPWLGTFLTYNSEFTGHEQTNPFAIDHSIYHSCLIVSKFEK